MEKVDTNKRVCAILIDFLFVALLQFIILNFLKIKPDNQLFLLFVPLFYIFRDSIKGQSPGKMIVGLRVVDDNQNPISFLLSFKRNIILFWQYFIPVFIVSSYVPSENNTMSLKAGFLASVGIITLLILIIEYVAATGSKEGRRLGDRIAKTTVVDLKPERPNWIYAVLGLITFSILFAISSF